MQSQEELLAEIDTLKMQNKSLAEDNEKLQKLNEWYEQQLKLNRKKMYGQSSEHTDMDQLNLFNEAESERAPINSEPTIETITYKRKKQKGHREKLLADLPVETIEYKLPEEEQMCPKCSGDLHVMNKEVRRELKIIPAQVKVVEHVSYVYACRNCDKTDVETPIITANSKKGLIPKSLVSPSIMAYIMHQKFVNAMPLYRQEQEFKRMNVMLSRQTLANWMIKGADILKPFADELKKIMLSKEVLHADETTLEVLCEPNRPAKSTSYMWLYQTSGCDKPIVIYDYQEGRSGSYAKAFLSGFKGYLHTDGWGGYHQLEPDITLCGCWAHLRRKFDEALAVMKDKDPNSTAGIGLNYCNKLFEIEREIASNLPDQCHDIRQEKSKKITDEFFSWVEIQSTKSLPKSLVGTALGYAINQKKYLLSFLKDGRIELSNNRAERSIKPFVIGRKNWLFCNTPAGAKSSAIIYSIIETAKQNYLKPFEYLTFLFDRLHEESENFDDILPWSKTLPPECMMKNNK